MQINKKQIEKFPREPKSSHNIKTKKIKQKSKTGNTPYANFN
jgi:hypothetical protein